MGTAVGHQTTASGDQSFAGGEDAIASGSSAIAIGFQSVADGGDSIAIGGNRSSADAGTAGALASGPSTTAVGGQSIAVGPGCHDIRLESGFRCGTGHGAWSPCQRQRVRSVAVGEAATASADFAIAQGDNAVALGVAIYRHRQLQLRQWHRRGCDRRGQRGRRRARQREFDHGCRRRSRSHRTGGHLLRLAIFGRCRTRYSAWSPGQRIRHPISRYRRGSDASATLPSPKATTRRRRELRPSLSATPA